MTTRSHPFRSGHVVRAALIVVTFVFCAAVAAFPLRTWFDQRAELGEAEDRRAELLAEIEASEARIADKIEDEGVRRDARCFAHYVEPGAELYTVPGVRGCVTAP